MTHRDIWTDKFKCKVKVTKSYKSQFPFNIFVPRLGAQSQIIAVFICVAARDISISQINYQDMVKEMKILKSLFTQFISQTFKLMKLT